MALYTTPDQYPRIVHPEEESFALEELYKLIGVDEIGFYTTGDLSQDKRFTNLICDDNARMIGRGALNVMATLLYGDTILGNALFCWKGEIQ